MSEERLDNAELLLEKFVDTERLDLIEKIISKAYDLDLGLGNMHEELTIAEICLLSVGAIPGAATESSIATVAEYLEILSLLGIPIKTRLKDMNPAQKQAQEDGQEFLKSMNEFKAMWAKANKGVDSPGI